MSRGRTFAMDYRPIAGGGWVTLVEDITERQRKDYAMRIQFERFDQAINQMSHGLCAVDAEHRIVLFNPRFLEMFGLSPKTLSASASRCATSSSTRRSADTFRAQPASRSGSAGSKR